MDNMTTTVEELLVMATEAESNGLVSKAAFLRDLAIETMWIELARRFLPNL